MSKPIRKAIAYVRSNKTWSEEQESLALRKINQFRCDIYYADRDIANKIADLMDEYGRENDLPDDWWRTERTEDDIFFEL